MFEKAELSSEAHKTPLTSKKKKKSFSIVSWTIKNLKATVYKTWPFQTVVPSLVVSKKDMMDRHTDSYDKKDIPILWPGDTGQMG